MGTRGLARRRLPLRVRPPVKLGHFELGPGWLSPMADVSQRAFRIVCRELGAALATTELLPPEVFLANDARSVRLRSWDVQRESPVSVQLHGVDEALMARAAVAAVANGAEVLDLNVGNPLGGAKSALLEPKRAGRMVRVLRSATGERVPVTVKTRSGIHSDREVFALAAEVEQAGCAAIAVHPRTRAQRYSGHADWKLLAELKRVLRIPVVGNGDVRTVDDARRMISETGVDAVLIGRGALGNPWLFSRLDGKAPPDAAARLATMQRHWALDGDEASFRRHLRWYARSATVSLEGHVGEVIQRVAQATHHDEPGLCALPALG